MPSYYDENQGFFVHKPSWHRLESQILKEYPKDWEDARLKADLTWDPLAVPIYQQVGNNITVSGKADWAGLTPRFEVIPGQQLIKRSDTHAPLSVQTTDYRVISNTDLGLVIDTVLGVGWEDRVDFEGLFTLHGGKLVIALIRNKKTRMIFGDSSATLEYTVVCSRHDGNGGLKIIKTNVRVVCANTWGIAEHASKDEVTAFTIRHVGNWDERVAEVRDKLSIASEANELYYSTCNALAETTITNRVRERFLAKFLPIGSDMSDRQKKNRYDEREQVRTILAGPTCEGINNTAYGLLQAAGEWCDHYRRFRTVDTYVTRTLVSYEPMKARAFRLTSELAHV